MGLEAPYVGNPPEPDERVTASDLRKLTDTAEEVFGFIEDLEGYFQNFDDESLPDHIDLKPFKEAGKDLVKQIEQVADEAESNGVIDV
jgi:hypothetical protein